jgi:sialic acid synthase SpsE
MVKYIRDVELALGTGKKVVTDKEQEIAKKLRKVDTL